MSGLFDLTDRTAIITGASRGLGKEMALALGEAGADLLITSRTQKNIEAAAEQIASATGRNHFSFNSSFVSPGRQFFLAPPAFIETEHARARSPASSACARSSRETNAR